MPTTGSVFVAAVRSAALIAFAVLGTQELAVAQTTAFKLTIFTSAGVYQGTSRVTSDPAGIDCVSESSGNPTNTGTCVGEFAAGSEVVITATPLYGGTFDGWADACAGQGATCRLVMTGPLTTSPKTIAKTFTLTVQGTGNAEGFVFSVDGFARPPLLCGIKRGGVTTGTCQAEYPANKQVFLSSDAGIFVSGPRYFGCGTEPYGFDCRFVMDGPRTVLVGFLAPEIIVSGDGNGTGVVTGSAPGSDNGELDCTLTGSAASGTCTATWGRSVPPSNVTLIATPTGNSVFAGWSGKCSGTGSTCSIALGLDSLEVTARFTTPTFLVSVTSAGSGSGRVTSDPAQLDCVITNGAPGVGCSSLFSQGTSVTLTADPSGGSTFGGWTGTCSGAQSTCVFVVNAETQATAQFNPPRPAAELAAALLGRLTMSDEEQHQLDRFGNKDGSFNLGDLLALLARTGQRLPTSTMSALLAGPRTDAAPRPERRNP
jgi:hypothetical protein